MRNAAVLAKQIATLDALSGGRLIVGVGVGWNEKEFANIGQADRFRVRGRYLDETIALWRHLWSGTSRALPRPVPRLRGLQLRCPCRSRGTDCPSGSEAVRRLPCNGPDVLGDGYHASTTDPAQIAERVPVIRAAAAEAGRPEPRISVRVRVAPEGASWRGYALSGGPEDDARRARCVRARRGGPCRRGPGRDGPAASRFRRWSASTATSRRSGAADERHRRASSIDADAAPRHGPSPRAP